MAIDYSYYSSVNSAYGDIHDRDTITGEVQRAMDEDLRNNLITEFDVKIGMDFYRETVLVNFEKELDCIIKFKRMKEAVYNSSARELLCRPGGVKTGDYVQHTNKQAPYDVRNYLVRNNIDPKKGYESSFILICQHSLKWIENDDKTVIHDYPVSFIDNKTMLGEKDSKIQTTQVDVQQCFIQENEFTKRIGNDKRFISNGETFKVVGIDKQTINGLITLRLEKIPSTKNDNMELGIADYYNNGIDDGGIVDPPNPVNPVEGYILKLDGEDDILYGFEEDYAISISYGGVVMPDEIIEWYITNEDGTSLPYATITSRSGYTCTVQGGISRYIGKSVVLRANLQSNSSVFIEKTIKITNFF